MGGAGWKLDKNSSFDLAGEYSFASGEGTSLLGTGDFSSNAFAIHTSWNKSFK